MEQIEQRRCKVEKIAGYMGIYSTKFDLCIISKKDLDLLFLIDMGVKFNTLAIVSKFLTTYLIQLVEKTNIFPQSSGLFLIPLNYLNRNC